MELETLDAGARVADAVAHVIGSWRFIIVQSLAFAGWITLNGLAIVQRWDPYPFILLNLALSFQAAYSGPIIMMSQNRQAAKDRLTAEHDYQVNVRAELEVAEVCARLDDLANRQWEELLRIQAGQSALLAAIQAEIAEMRAVHGGPDEVIGNGPSQRSRT